MAMIPLVVVVVCRRTTGAITIVRLMVLVRIPIMLSVTIPFPVVVLGVVVPIGAIGVVRWRLSVAVVRHVCASKNDVVVWRKWNVFPGL